MIVAERVAEALAATEYSIVPLAPVPLAPEVIVSQDALETAVHEHDGLLVVTVTLPLPPDGSKFAEAGARAVTVQN